MIVQTGDFVGEYKVSLSRFTELEQYIVTYEKHYLKRLLGADLYTLFIADLTGVTPQVSQTYLSIFNAFDTDSNGCLIISEGIKKMLIQFIYFHYVRDMQHFTTVTGTVQNVNENSTMPTYNGHLLIEHFNKGVATYNNIQWFIGENESNYTQYNGITLDYISGI